MKIFTLLLLPPILVAAAATATLAHVDSLGQPDPSWQQPAAAARDSRVPADGAAPAEDFFSSGGLSLLLLALGALLALDLATGTGSRSAPATTLPAAAPPGPPAEGFRTVEVLPASASRETRYVLRAAVAIAFAAILWGELHASDRKLQGREVANAQPLSGDTTPRVARP